jgi:hypothetical protein
MASFQTLIEFLYNLFMQHVYKINDDMYAVT